MLTTTRSHQPAEQQAAGSRSASHYLRAVRGEVSAGSASGQASQVMADRSVKSQLPTRPMMSQPLVVALALLLILTSFPLNLSSAAPLTAGHETQREQVALPPPALETAPRSEAIEPDENDILLLVLEDELPQPKTSRTLKKRSGISDHRLAEIQMIRALKKQLERASKLAASSSMSPVPEGIQQELNS